MGIAERESKAEVLKVETVAAAKDWDRKQRVRSVASWLTVLHLTFFRLSEFNNWLQK